MADFTLVDPTDGWEYDLHSVYSAYLGHFQQHNIPWWDRTWGPIFSSFEAFLQFGWPVIVVTDAWSRTAHVVTRTDAIGAFIRMVKTRFGENLSRPENMLRVAPFETHQRPLRTISDISSFRKLHATLPAALLMAQKVRMRSGDTNAIANIWENKNKTFLALSFEWSERNASSCLEWGYAAVRCGHLDTLGIWPPVPDANYRKGHYIVAEYIDKPVRRYQSAAPFEYAWGESYIIPKSKLGIIIQATIDSLASPDSETQSNTLVLLGHSIGGNIERFSDLKIKLPSNMLVIDTAIYERQLFTTGHRGIMGDPLTNKPRVPGSTLSLPNFVRSVGVDADNLCKHHNSGNDAFMALLAFQLLLQPDTDIPRPRSKLGTPRANLNQRTLPSSHIRTSILSGHAVPTLSLGAPAPLLAVSSPTKPTHSVPWLSSLSGKSVQRQTSPNTSQSRQVHSRQKSK